MNKIKLILVFVLGVVAGGLIFGFQGPAPSQAGNNLPSDLFYLKDNYSDKQALCIKNDYQEKYRVLRVDKTSEVSINVWLSIKKTED